MEKLIKAANKKQPTALFKSTKQEVEKKTKEWIPKIMRNLQDQIDVKRGLGYWLQKLTSQMEALIKIKNEKPAIGDEQITIEKEIERCELAIGLLSSEDEELVSISQSLPNIEDECLILTAK